MEKPKNPPTNLAVTGIYFLTPKFFKIYSKLKPSWRNELEITDALQIMLDEQNKISFEMITDYWKDTGTPNDIIHANAEILKNMKPYFLGKQKLNSKISGNVMLGKNSLVLENSHVIGPCIIGNDCIIGPNTIIGPNVSIDDKTKTSNCTIKNSIIMKNCLIDSEISLDNSIIASNSKIVIDNNIENRTFLLGEGTRLS